MRHPLDTDAFRTNPYDALRVLREKDPVCRIQREPAETPEFVLTRYEDVQTALRDERFSVNRLRSARFRNEAERLPESLQPENQNPSLLNLDRPDHTRLRNLICRDFTPHRVDDLTARITRRVHRLLDDLEGTGLERTGSVDVIANYAIPLPVWVIADLLGIPEDEGERFSGASDRMLRTLVGTRSDLDGFRAAREDLDGLFRKTLAERRRRPEDDLISALAAAHEVDALSEGEILGTCLLILVAGHETTSNLIGNAIWVLLDEPTRVDVFRADPGRAIEEILRFESPIQAAARVTTTDVELGGTVLPTGALVSAMLGAANRDPDVFVRPDDLDLTREENPHVAFGYGIHFCLGAALARLEARIALVSLFDRFPRIVRAESRPQWRRSMLLRGHRCLPVRIRDR